MSVHSVSVAKERLKNLLVSDRMQCTPEAVDRLEGDLYHTVSKYVEVRRRGFGITGHPTDIKIKKKGEKHLRGY